MPRSVARSDGTGDATELLRQRFALAGRRQDADAEAPLGQLARGTAPIPLPPAETMATFPVFIDSFSGWGSAEADHITRPAPRRPSERNHPNATVA